MPTSKPMVEAYALLLKRIETLEAQVAAIREEVDELRAQLKEGWIGGTE